MRRYRFGFLILAAAVGMATAASAADGKPSEPTPSLEYRPKRLVIPEPKAPKPLPPMTVFREAIGSFGIMSGSFDRPLDVAWDKTRDKDGNFYVLDVGNSRVQMFDNSSKFVLSIGSYGIRETNMGEFVKPRAIAVTGLDSSSEILYVVDTGNDRIQMFGWVSPGACPECPARRDGKRLKRIKTWGRTGIRDGELKSPLDIAIFPPGGDPSIAGVYILDSGNERVQRFTSEGEFLEKWEKSSFGVTGGIFTDLTSIALSTERFGYFYLLGAGCLVQQFSLGGGTAGTLVNSWPAIAPESGLCVPGRIEVDRKNNFVYVLDAGNSLLMCYNPDGLYRWALRGAQGPFSRPLGFAVDFDGGEFLVADTENNIVQKFSLR